uniref:DNA-directed RNA polymerases IV and V subunit 4 n=1 Tax=Arabidopsis thaliana TaxID=3702 RepID=NRPD4_ARATH|nr:RecName: Full=DNA-directed RNA polymerases IV and V subunit 4; AltName: Full=Protein RNA-DIRECTED DNA METHYLATION 2; AltName: Full=RNA polymerase II, Rpb4, core protein [Arabidopsis thaliana]8HYJ_D Chain D, DNA-directed RNA polymerases IV and V subunit 4 [Arabidopsis thaliana]
MSEKGGKGLKSSLKSKDGGKDGSSTKLKKGRKIHFDQRTPPANYKILNVSSDQQPFQSSAAKCGKSDKPTKSSKNSLHSFELKDLPENAECMMDCEAFQILDGIKGQLVGLSEDPSIKIPVSYDRALAYVESCVHYTNPQSVRKVLEPLKTYGISDGEMCVIANASSESVDEVLAFIPSLKTKKEVINQPLQDALEELSKLKKSE